jgi:hypothetical protein
MRLRLTVWFGRMTAAFGLMVATLSARAAPPAKPGVDFNKQVRPILSEHCFACHGPDEKERKAKFRLDTKEGAFAALRRGGHAIVAGKPADSMILERVTDEQPSRLMPPVKFGKKLKADQVEILRRWIEQGAEWTEHWAFRPLTRPPLPKVADAGWRQTPVDDFILARLEAAGLKPSPRADKATLLRRVTLDLTGLPPTLEELDAFLADSSSSAFDKVVDRLLRSSRYGEHEARYWLDLARYGDTHGLHLDNYREMWLYRDWVVTAFNSNKPFDQFLIEQLAGDLLPNATLDQKIASGFNRCHVTTSEGGSISEEIYVRNVVDRVDTTGIVALGLTVGCARCHDHKYDPIKMTDYYGMFAFFNNLDDNPLDGNAARHAPVLAIPTAEQKVALQKIDEKIASTNQRIASELAKVDYDPAKDPKEPEKVARTEFVWIDDDLPPGVKPSADGGVNGRWDFVSAPAHPVFSGSRSTRRSADGLSQHYFEGAPAGLRVGEGDTLFAYVYLDPAKPAKEIMLQWHTDTWRHRAYWGDNLIDWGHNATGERQHLGSLPAVGKWVRLEVPIAKVGLKPGQVITGWAFTQFGGTVYWDKAGIVTEMPQNGAPAETLAAWVRARKADNGANLPKPIQDLVKVDPGKRSPAQTKELRDYFVTHAFSKTKAIFEPLRRALTEAQNERAAIDKQVPATLVSFERPEVKQAFVLKRGEYDRRGDPIGRATPAFLPPMSPNLPRNRLGFAQWLVAPTHPLTARVAVNRFWQQLFGTGLVKTAEDFGSQGEPPSHPELLDWLAVRFQEEHWDVKWLLKLLVTSAVYQQAPRVTPDRLAADPANRLLARGPRFRLDAEMLRDQALAVGGLLIEKVGGPGVRPPQPSGLWEAVGYLTSNTRNFVQDHGNDKVHRRSLYTFWKRTAPPPQMNTFDAPSRESCMARRERTNTPLQALLLLNDVQYVEAARALAERTLHQGGSTVDSRVAYMFRLVTARRPDARELAELTGAYRDHLTAFSKDVSAAQKLLAVGETPVDPKLNPRELAAWTLIANLVLNLDEVLNKG